MAKNQRAIYKGNFYNGIEDKSGVSIYRSSEYDIEIIEEDGKKYYYQCRYYNNSHKGYEYHRIDPVVLKDKIPTQWEHLEYDLRLEHYITRSKEGHSLKQDVFIGEKPKFDDLSNWIKKHKVISKEITLLLYQEIGQFETVEFDRKYRRTTEGYLSNFNCDYDVRVYFMDDFYVEIAFDISNKTLDPFGEHPRRFIYVVEKLETRKEEEAIFGKRYRLIESKTGAPKELIRLLIRQLEEDKAIVRILNQMKRIRKEITRGNFTKEEEIYIKWLTSPEVELQENACYHFLGYENWYKLQEKYALKRKISFLCRYMAGS